MRLRILVLALVVLAACGIVSYFPGYGANGAEIDKDSARTRSGEIVNIDAAASASESLTSHAADKTEARTRATCEADAAVKSKFTILGRIMSSTGFPIENAQVKFGFDPSAYANGYGLDKTIATDTNGKFVFQFDVPAKNFGRVTYQFSAGRHIPLEGSASLGRILALNENLSFDFNTITMSRGNELRGKLLLADGTPFGEGGSVHFELLSDGVPDRGDFTTVPARELLASADPRTGEFVIHGPRPGLYRIYGGAWSDEWFEAPSMYITDEDTDNYQFHVPAAARIVKKTGTFILRLSAREPIPRGHPIYFDNANDVVPRRAEANEFIFEQLPADGGMLQIGTPGYFNDTVDDSILTFPYAPKSILVSEVIGQTLFVELEHVGLYTFTPRVLDRETRKPIPNAKIHISLLNYGKEYPANFSITVARRHKNFNVFANGYKYERIDFTNRDLGNLGDVEILLDKTDPLASIAGRIIQKRGKQSLSSAEVEATRQVVSSEGNFVSRSSCNINTDQTFTLPGLAPGDYTIVVSMDRVHSEPVAVHVNSGERLENVEIELPNWTSAKVKIVNLTNFDASACNLQFRSKDSDVIFSSRAHPNGIFEFASLPRKLYSVQLELPKMFLIRNIESASEAGFTIDLGGADLANANEEKSLTFDAAGKSPSFVNVLLTINGRPEPMYSIIGWRMQPERPVLRASGGADAAGKVRIGPVTAGSLQLDVIHPAQMWWLPAQEPITVADGANHNIPVDILVRDATLRIENAKGEVLINTSVTIQYFYKDRDGYIPFSRTTSSSGELRLQFPDQKITIQAKSSESTISATVDWKSVTNGTVVQLK